MDNQLKKSFFQHRHVFISYSAEDREIANKIAELLDKLNISYFLDVKNIDWGQSITREVRQGLCTATDIIVVLSPASLKSPWVPYEVGHAVASNKRLLPFATYTSLNFPAYISGLTYLTKIEDIERYFTFSRDTRSNLYLSITWLKKNKALAEVVRLNSPINHYYGDVDGQIFSLSLYAYSEKMDLCTMVSRSSGVYKISGYNNWDFVSLQFKSFGPEDIGSINLKRDLTDYIFSGFSTIMDWRRKKIEPCRCHWLKLRDDLIPSDEEKLLQLAQTLLTIKGRTEYYDNVADIMRSARLTKDMRQPSFASQIIDPYLEIETQPDDVW